MRLAYDSQIFSIQEYGGVSRYFYELATRTAHLEEFDVTVLAGIHLNKYLARCADGLVRGRYLRDMPRTRKIRTRLNAAASKWWMSRLSPDILHETYYAESGVAPAGTTVVVTVHDLIQERFPDLFPAHDRTARLKAAAVDRADHVICVSQNTKNDLVAMLGVDPARASVVYHGYSLMPSSSVATLPLIDQPYILYVGMRGTYKNFSGLLEAYASSTELTRDFRLVCFGSAPLSVSEKEANGRLGLTEDRVLHMAGDDAVLANLYRNAAAFVCPSLYEGFGIPPLEAMHYGCPVVSSNAGSLSEVVGDAGSTFDPKDPQSIRSAIESVVYAPEHAQRLREAGKERTVMFSWEACAMNTQAVYRSLLLA